MTYSVTIIAGVKDTEYHFVVDTAEQVRTLVNESLMVKSVKVLDESSMPPRELSNVELYSLVAG